VPTAVVNSFGAVKTRAGDIARKLTPRVSTQRKVVGSNVADVPPEIPSCNRALRRPASQSVSKLCMHVSNPNSVKVKTFAKVQKNFAKRLPMMMMIDDDTRRRLVFVSCCKGFEKEQPWRS
jgi:hypothetical protein